MKRLIFLLLFLLLALGQTGCATLYMDARDSSTDVLGAFKPESTIIKVRSLFPTVDKSVAFEPAVMASSIPEIEEERLKIARLQTQRFILDRKLWGYEEYTFTGWIADTEYWKEGAGMVDGMTLSLATPFLIPEINREIANEKKRVHRFRVWYNSDLHYYAHQTLYDSNWPSGWTEADLKYQKEIEFYGE